MKNFTWQKSKFYGGLFFLIIGSLMMVLVACNSDTQLKPGDEIPAPQGDVVVALSGLTSRNETVQLDMATLESMGLQEVTVNDPWEEKEVTYSGVTMADLLQVVGVSDGATELFVTATDGYALPIPLSELQDGSVLLATRSDGQQIPADNKGPTRIIFPYDTYPNQDLAQAFSVWSVDTMEVR